MMRRSRIIQMIKDKEMEEIKRLSPDERLDLEVSHSELVRDIFLAGLKAKGFSSEEIDLIWRKRL